jgi:phosphate ABC transporter phosphate-binding protein
MKIQQGTIIALALLATAGCGDKGKQEGDLKASGSTFVAPLMEKWAGEYGKKHGLTINYAGNGSGAGVFQMIEQKVDFACTDAPLDEQELLNAKATGGEVIHIPLTVSAVVPIYNLEEKGPSVRFTGPLLADIYLGKIKKWNDPRLQAVQEPAMKLPDQNITVVHRSDGSGTTHVFTEYLAKVSPEWQEKVGAGTAVKWPLGAGQNGNRWVSEHVKRTPGAIGYVSLDYAISGEHQFGAVQNKAGQFLQAGRLEVAAALEGAMAQIPDDLRYSLTDASGKDAFPICGTTWAVVYTRPPRNARQIVDFLRWLLHEGQQFAPELHYTPLAPTLVDRADKKLSLIVEK